MSQILAKQPENFLLWGIGAMQMGRAQVASRTENQSKGLLSGPAAAGASTPNNLWVPQVSGFNLQEARVGSSGDAVCSLDARGFCLRVSFAHAPDTTAETPPERPPLQN